MRGLILLTLAFFMLSICFLSYGQEGAWVELKGIWPGMRKKQLIDSWGYPAKRETKERMDVWYYANENTPHPTDGILVYFKNDKVKNWRLVENMYEEMEIWGKDAGIPHKGGER